MKDGQNLFKTALFFIIVALINFVFLLFDCLFVFKDNFKGFSESMKIVMVEINIALLFK